MNDIVEKIVEGATFELPTPMIDEQIDRQVQRAQRELQMQGIPGMRSCARSARPKGNGARISAESAVESLASSVVLREIAEKEGSKFRKTI